MGDSRGWLVIRKKDINDPENEMSKIENDLALIESIIDELNTDVIKIGGKARISAGCLSAGEVCFWQVKFS